MVASHSPHPPFPAPQAWLASISSLSIRADGNGGSHDVHHGVPADRDHWAQRLEAPDMGLWLVVCVGDLPSFRSPGSKILCRGFNVFLASSFSSSSPVCLSLAWISFGCCMASAVFTLNSYTKTAIEQHHRLRTRLEDSHPRKAPPYSEALAGDEVYSFADLPYCPSGVVGLADGVGLNGGDVPTLVLMGGCKGCEDCEREMDIMAARIARETEVSLC